MNTVSTTNGKLEWKQVDGVAMGSPLGPLMPNTFMCSLEEKLACENKLPSFYKRYVDNTLVLVRDLPYNKAMLTAGTNGHC